MARVAEELGVAAAYLSQIANGVRPCPAERVVEIERACSHEVRRWELRPDDWHRIWPELIGAEGAPAVAGAALAGGAHCVSAKPGARA